MLVALAAFAVAGALVVLIPGPDTLVVLRSIAMHGRRSAVLTTLGVLTGLSIWATAAALGLTALLRASHDAYLALRIVGAAYLLTVGVRAIWRRSPASFSVASGRSLVGRGYRAGLTTDLLNPKVGVFFITFLPAFVPRGASAGPLTLAMGAVFVAETAVYLGLMMVFVERLTAWLRSERFQRRLNRVTGVVLIGFGVRLLVEG